MAHQFCRDLCHERGESMVGTGEFAARTILVAWPRGKWRVPRYESVDMSPALAAAIRDALDADIHVALVDRVGETGKLAQAQADGIAADFDSEAELAAAITRYIAGTPLPGRPDDRPVILCCTDSRRDACCARYGFETFKALRAAVDPAQFNLLQCTHVGGCRFAASLVVLPQRQRYGRLTPDDVGDFLATIARGAVYLPASRGRTGLPETAQLAEHAGLEWALAHGSADPVELADGPWPDDGDGMDGEEISREIVAGSARLRVVLRSTHIEAATRCTSIGKPTTPRPRWSVRSLQRIS